MIKTSFIINEEVLAKRVGMVKAVEIIVVGSSLLIIKVDSNEPLDLQPTFAGGTVVVRTIVKVA